MIVVGLRSHLEAVASPRLTASLASSQGGSAEAGERLKPGNVSLLNPVRIEDERGWFSETYSARTMAARGIDMTFVQDNQSLSKHAFTLRGIHFQAPPHGQSKLVRCLRGRVFDIAVDLRRDSPSYGKWVGTILSAENGAQLLIPLGFGHAFLTLEANCEVAYKTSAYYDPVCEGALRWDDQDIGVAWPMPAGHQPNLSPKDMDLPGLVNFRSAFDYDGHPLAALGAGHAGNV